MDEELRKEIGTATRMHILIYRFLLKFYQQQKLFDDKLYEKIKMYILILKSLDHYNERILVRSTYNIGVLIAMFDRCASPKAQSFFDILKNNLVIKMKKLKHLKKCLMINKPKSDKSPKKQDLNGTVSTSVELIPKIKTIFNMTYSEKAIANKWPIGEKIKKKKRKTQNSTPKKKVKSQAQVKDRMNEPTLMDLKTEVIELDDDIETDNFEDFVDLISSEEEMDSLEHLRIEEEKFQQLKERTESVFNGFEIIHFDKERETSFVNNMIDLYKKVNKDQSYGPVSRILRKLDLSSSLHDYSLNEVGVIPVENVLETFNTHNEKVYHDRESVPSHLHSKVPLCTVGPLQVRCHEDESAFYCTVDTCKNWCTTKPSFLHRHIQHMHSDLKWDWSCSNCPVIDATFMKSTDLCDLEWCFKHLMSAHVERKKLGVHLLEKYQEKNDSYVPGKNSDDKISDIKISNVVTLHPSFKREDSYLNINKISEVPKLFQCPNHFCRFTSDCEMTSFKHFLKEFDGIESHKCTYCERMFIDSFGYCGHILKDHGMDKYQCTYCSYRSISKNNVIHHQIDEHTSNSVKVLIGKDRSQIKGMDMGDLDKKYDTSSLVPYKCTKKDCGFKTHIVKCFCEHLSKSHSNNTGYRCHHRNCNYITNIPDVLVEHMPEHGIGEFQCKYCPFASNNRQAIRRHMYKLHASKLPHCYQRAAFDQESGKISKQFTSISCSVVDNESIVHVDLDSSNVENLWDAEIIQVEEYEKFLTNYDCSLIGQENYKDDIKENKSEGIERIELSDSEYDEIPPNQDLVSKETVPQSLVVNNFGYREPVTLVKSKKVPIKVFRSIKPKPVSILNKPSAAKDKFHLIKKSFTLVGNNIVFNETSSQKMKKSTQDIVNVPQQIAKKPEGVQKLCSISSNLRFITSSPNPICIQVADPIQKQTQLKSPNTPAEQNLVKIADTSGTYSLSPILKTTSNLVKVAEIPYMFTPDPDLSPNNLRNVAKKSTTKNGL